MKFRMLGAAAGLAVLPMLAVAQSTPNRTPVIPPIKDSATKDTTATGPITGKTEMTPLDSNRTNAGVNATTNAPTINLTPQTNPTTDSTTNSTGTGANANTTTNSNTNTNINTNTTGMNMGSAPTSNAPVTGMISSSGAAPAAGSAFAMGTHSAARDSLVGPRREPPGNGTTCPWGCPTSKGNAGLTGPQFLALQQELRDRRCGNKHVTGRLDAATRTAIRSCAKKMGVAPTAAAVLVGFDIGFSASDVGISSSGAVKQEE